MAKVRADHHVVNKAIGPDFNAAERAFYYVRVLENPTCRWTMHRALATHSTPPAGEAAVIQERAWSSPIWYTPRGR